ncbi:helix-turn-helix transcriptional regulator [Candidatus Sumerlaeota bacterium]|nr:helix-turn-helix transcriptional regulator [Candidatus Sumerlaeota bacterium]
MGNQIGKTIERYRRSLGKTQDQLGAMYSVTGPAIFKFEKGYVKPSLELWMKIAYDAGLTPKKSLLFWIKDKLPDKYLEVFESIEADAERIETGEPKQPGYVRYEDREALRKAVLCDPSLPGPLVELFRDDEFWSLYKPRGIEIDHLIGCIASFGEGTTDMYRDALRLIRQFVELRR